ncbi:MAG: DUF3224 domain-containing protein, partial [Acidobacteria bacterium]|nr:DUF3224 domain-containing protein [Acidobacteriota bacterium]
MHGKILRLIFSLGVLLLGITAHSKEQRNMTSSNAPARTHAQAKILVESSEAKPYDQTVSPPLMEISITEKFSGDIDGESTVRALQVQNQDKSAHMISMQRFRGNLAGRQGTFVLQGREIVVGGKIKAAWFVVPGSGTG